MYLFDSFWKVTFHGAYFCIQVLNGILFQDFWGNPTHPHAPTPTSKNGYQRTTPPFFARFPPLRSATAIRSMSTQADTVAVSNITPSIWVSGLHPCVITPFLELCKLRHPQKTTPHMILGTLSIVHFCEPVWKDNKIGDSLLQPSPQRVLHMHPCDGNPNGQGRLPDCPPAVLLGSVQKSLFTKPSPEGFGHDPLPRRGHAGDRAATAVTETS